jgi:hypothetical protein
VSQPIGIAQLGHAGPNSARHPSLLLLHQENRRGLISLQLKGMFEMAAINDVGVDPSSMTPDGLVDWLQRRIVELAADVRASDVWLSVTSNQVPVSEIIGILKQIYLEISMYQPDAIEAAMASIAQFPRKTPVALIDEMLHHQVEEFDHGEMAIRDYVALGGTETDVRGRAQSPSAFAIAAIWRNITHKRDPFAYLGAVYLFDALTPIVTDEVRVHLSKRLGTADGLEFIVHHATADKEHEEQIRNLIRDIAGLYPEKIEAIIYGFEYFAFVYPLPCWTAAKQRADRIARSLLPDNPNVNLPAGLAAGYGRLTPFLEREGRGIAVGHSNRSKSRSVGPRRLPWSQAVFCRRNR